MEGRPLCRPFFGTVRAGLAFQSASLQLDLDRERPSPSPRGLDRQRSSRAPLRALLICARLQWDSPTGTPAKRKGDNDPRRLDKASIYHSKSIRERRPPVARTRRSRMSPMQIALSLWLTTLHVGFCPNLLTPLRESGETSRP